MTPTLQTLLVYVVLPLLAGGAAVVLRRALRRLLHRRRVRTSEENDLHDRLREVLRGVPSRPQLLSGATRSPLSLLVEARLLSGCPSQAMWEAEQEVVQNPADAGAFVAMAKALLYSQREEEARASLRWAQRLGADDPEFDYLRARLARPDHGALDLCLRACRREPGYAEALYLCARLCLRLGFSREGERLLKEIAPLMCLSVERLSYFQELQSMEVAERPPARGLLKRLSPSAPGEDAPAAL